MGNPLPSSLPGGVTAGPGGFGGVLYNLPGLMDAVGQIHGAAVSTQQNYESSLKVLQMMYHGGSGQYHGAYEHAHTLLNQAYNMSQDAIAQAGVALNMATDGMRETDAQLASQYMNAGGLY
ncbi:MAG: hypothetical protein J2P17_31980 [Mycobacterium sp.]|nr:hypothetical protein [Mycobacterium sp.]